ncbi:MAG: metal ABC transporter ATP-binding protein [Chloroflexi bacterium]|nr:metal ABC transporter ATP-binding protein [Chloroflexota bacterium]
MNGDDIVSLKNVRVYFEDVLILEDITLSIFRNEFLAVVGPNGAGKTTLLKVMLGLIKPDTGEVRVFETTPEEGRKYIGYVPQLTSFDPEFPINVFDVVLMGRYRGLFKKYSAQDRKAAESALETVGMLEYGDRQISKLSGGQQQRVLIARALTREPRLLLLDEPTAGIDIKMEQSFYEMLSELKKKMTIVLVTHDTGVISTYVDNVACLNRRLYYHDSKEGSLEKMEELYQCPVELVAHGHPHRVLRTHEDG